MDNFFLCFVIVTSCIVCGCGAETLTATCDVEPNADGSSTQSVRGVVTFTQDSAGGDTTIAVELTGFSIADSDTRHGFHVHETGTITPSCTETGGHYNPDGLNHGAPGDTVRHVGDLGNIEENSSGAVSITFTDSVISLSGTQSIVDRAIVVHASEDDLGRGNETDSLTTGHAGARLSCCVIHLQSAAWRLVPSFLGVSVTLFMLLLKL